MTTVTNHFKDWRPRTGKPRAELARILRISEPYALDIARGTPIGSTERLAQVVGTFGLTAEDTLETLKEWYPHHFSNEAADPTQDPEADRESTKGAA